MKSSFNAYGRSASKYGPLHIPIWLGIVKRIPVGGVLDEKYNIAGALYPAGMPIEIRDKVIKPFVAFEVVSFTAASGEATDDIIVIKPASFGGASFAPEANDYIMKVGDSFSANGKAAKVKSVAAAEGGNYSVAVAHSASVDSVSAGNFIALSAATAAGNNKSLAVKPNAYLFHDIWLGNLDAAEDDTFATGAAVMYHPEGILIDRTPAADFKEAMMAAVPGVLQVPEDAPVPSNFSTPQFEEEDGQF